MGASTYTCGTCGNQTIIVACTAGVWQVRCGYGHVFVPVPGTEIVIGPGDAQVFTL